MYSNACCASITVTFFRLTSQKLFSGFVLAVEVALCLISVLSKTGHSVLSRKLGQQAAAALHSRKMVGHVTHSRDIF